MLQELHSLDSWIDFIRDVNADTRYRSPMLQCERQLRENLLDAPETFRVILALDGRTLAGYLDVTQSAAVNEIYDLYVAEPYRRRGFARAMLAEAIAQNGATGLIVLTEAADRAVTALYQSMGFVPAAGENSVLASMTLT